MIVFLMRHLLESTFFCALLCALASCLRKNPTARYAVLLMGVAKFAIPSVLLARTGGEIAFLFPATSWVSVVAGRISSVFAALLDLFPADKDLDLLAGWACGTAVLIAIWLIRLRNRKPVLTLPTEQEQAALMRARVLLALRQPIRLRCSESAAEPALRGICYPTVTVQKGLSERLTPGEFEAVLLHELAHARRFDNLSAVFVHALVCVFWFHPLLWLVERQLNRERERACDETVLACGAKPQVYAAGILKVCQFHLFEGAAGVSAMTGAGLKERLELILGNPAPARLLCVPWLLAPGLAIFMTLVPIAGGYCEQCGSNGQNWSDSAAVLHCKPSATCQPAAPRKLQ